MRSIEIWVQILSLSLLYWMILREIAVYLRLNFTSISLPSFSVCWGSHQVTCEKHITSSSHSDSGTHSCLLKWLFSLLRKISYLRIGAQQRCPCGFFKASSIWGHVVFGSHWVHHVQTPLYFSFAFLFTVTLGHTCGSINSSTIWKSNRFLASRKINKSKNLEPCITI